MDYCLPLQMNTCVPKNFRLKSAISAFVKNCQYDEAFLNQNALTLTTVVSDHDSSPPEEKFLRNLYESGP